MMSNNTTYMNKPNSDGYLFDFIRDHLFVAAVSDILDEIGYSRQVMHHRLRPLLPDMKKCGFIGRARTFRWMDIDHVPDDPYGLEIEAMDSLKKNDVVIHSTDYDAGIRPLDSKGRAIVTSYDVPVRCGDVLVNPGDIVYADFDGIVVIPKAVENEVFEKAQEKIHRENLSRQELLAGKTLREVYDKYKSL